MHSFKKISTLACSTKLTQKSKLTHPLVTKYWPVSSWGSPCHYIWAMQSLVHQWSLPKLWACLPHCYYSFLHPLFIAHPRVSYRIFCWGGWKTYHAPHTYICVYVQCRGGWGHPYKKILEFRLSEIAPGECFYVQVFVQDSYMHT